MYTDFYVETPIIYTLKQIIIMYHNKNKIGIKGGVLPELNISSFSSNFSNIPHLSLFPVFFHCGNEVIRNFIFIKKENITKITIPVFKNRSKL
jgi:hypothetical protein